MKPPRPSLLQTCVLPLLLAALAARALVPAGFMAGNGGLTFTVAMCSADSQRTERLQLFGDVPDPAPRGGHARSCEYCLAPVHGAAADLPRVATTAESGFVLRVAADSQIATQSLLRAQSPRGPPHA